MFIFAAAVQGAATRYRGGETGGVGGRRRFAGPGPAKPKERGPAIWPAPAPLVWLARGPKAPGPPNAAAPPERWDLPPASQAIANYPLPFPTS